MAITDRTTMMIARIVLYVVMYGLLNVYILLGLYYVYY